MEYLLATQRSPRVRAVIEDPNAELYVPALCDVEVVSALRRLVLQHIVALERAREALAALLDLPLEREGHESILGRVLALRDNFSAFDAVYAALAEVRDATLVTADARLARAVRDHLSLSLIEA